MEKSPWEANSHSASQEIFRLILNPKVHYRISNSPQLVPTQIQMHPFHTFPLCFPKIHSNIIYHLRVGLQSGFFISDPLIKMLYAFLISPIPATFPAHLILFHLIYPVLVGEAHMLFIVQFSPASLHFLPLRSKYSPQHPVLKTPSVFLERPTFTSVQNNR
jgi:hypothetical protein